MVDSRNSSGLPDKDDWRTPTPVFRAIQRLTEVDFDLDPCTTPDNPLGLPHFYTREQDGLKQPWAPHKVFVNPPFSQKLSWVKKAIAEAHLGAEVVVVLEAQTDGDLFHDYLKQGYIYLLRRRISFWNHEGRKVGQPRRGHLLVYFGQNKLAPDQLLDGITTAELMMPSSESVA